MSLARRNLACSAWATHISLAKACLTTVLARTSGTTSVTTRPLPTRSSSERSSTANLNQSPAPARRCMTSTPALHYEKMLRAQPEVYEGQVKDEITLGEEGQSITILINFHRAMPYRGSLAQPIYHKTRYYPLVAMTYILAISSRVV